MRLTKSLVPTGAVLILSLSSVAFAAPKHLLPKTIAQNTEASQRPQGQYLDKLIQKLNLSQDQVQKIQAIRSQYKDKMTQPSQAMKQASQELQTLLVSTASGDEVREKYQQVQNLRQQVQALEFDQMLEIRDVLTPEQRSQAAALIQQRQQKFMERFKQLGQ